MCQHFFNASIKYGSSISLQHLAQAVDVSAIKQQSFGSKVAVPRILCHLMQNASGTLPLLGLFSGTFRVTPDIILKRLTQCKPRFLIPHEERKPDGSNFLVQAYQHQT